MASLGLRHWHCNPEKVTSNIFKCIVQLHFWSSTLLFRGVCSPSSGYRWTFQHFTGLSHPHFRQHHNALSISWIWPVSLGLFPTCQVRVVRFYQSCSSPSSPPPPPPRPPPSPPPPLPPLPSSLPPCQLFQALRQLPHAVGPAGPQLQESERTGHRWTSTWYLPSSVSTAGPQPGTVRAQWAPLDLNLGPSELSEHRWTSTWDLPSSVSNAGPQPGTFRPQWAPLDLNGQIECQKICQIERQIACQIEWVLICQIESHKVCQIKCQNVCQIECQKICQIGCQKICQIECQIAR